MKSYYDHIIVGSGIAGLFTAINIKRGRTLLISKTELKSGSTPLAQGGIVSCRYMEDHFKDTLRAGSDYNLVEAVRAIEEDSKGNIEKLISIGVNFDRDISGNLKYTREGGHTKNTILYAKDRTGKEIVEALIREVKELSNTDISEDTMLIKVNNFDGIKEIELLKGSKKYLVRAKNIILATGGVGELYIRTTNTHEATGDGIAVAKRMGAELKDMEFIQFHPTSIESSKEQRRFLISESLRGEGAILVNDLGERFMKKYHEMAELAPRDIVSRGIYRELLEGKKVYLDIRHESKTFLSNRFPTIYSRCLEEGIDISEQLLEVSPAEHYIMGGIKTDLYGRTNIAGLYACGECACTGVHGGNRLASNSLLEGIVFGNRIASILNEYEYKECYLEEAKFEKISNREYLKEELYKKLKNKLKQVMEYSLGIVRSKKGIQDAIKEISKIEDNLSENNSDSKGFYELSNMLTVAWEISNSASQREKSLGAHYLEDERRDRHAK